MERSAVTFPKKKKLKSYNEGLLDPRTGKPLEPITVALGNPFCSCDRVAHGFECRACWHVAVFLFAEGGKQGGEAGWDSANGG